MQRQFTSGSRQAPDPFDQYLEEHNFYRKHTARDASCLFRVVSEQMYDTQLHHLAIRKRCVRYMRKHREFFQQRIDRDLDEYLDDLSKPKTYGTLIELQAVGYMFQRNVMLFEPFDLGNLYISHANCSDIIRVFYTPERHFDSVFTCDYIKDVAVCQSVCYGILYKDLFKLPDVAYAVEHMLHPMTFEVNEYRSEYNESGYCTRIFLENGRTFEFDLPGQTNCILENFKLCHFHYKNFSNDLQRQLKVHGQNGAVQSLLNREDSDQVAGTLSRTTAVAKNVDDSVLPQKYVSCVRQLLQEGITPFPYKVAKALDPDMYRNIEFDAWNEARKEMKMANWYNGDANFKKRSRTKTPQKIFQVGAKCHVKLRKSENDLYTCHIQEMAVDKGYCLVFIEQLGEKRVVPYESLTPLPPDQFKPWSLPFRFHRHLQKCSSVRLTRHYNYNYRLKFNRQFSATHAEYCGAGGVDALSAVSPIASIKSSEYSSDMVSELSSKDKRFTNTTAGGVVRGLDDGSATRHGNCYYKLKQFTQLENFRTQTIEYCTMPLTVEHASPTDSGQKSKVGSANKEGGNSRTPSRSSNAPTGAALELTTTNRNESNNNGGAEDVITASDRYELADDAAQGTANELYATADYHFYQVPFYGGTVGGGGGVAYGSAEDYINYGYDGGALINSPTVMMPMTTAGGGAGGGLYYMCQQNMMPPAAYGAAAAHHMYMPTAVNPQGLPVPTLIGTPTGAAPGNQMSQLYYSGTAAAPYYAINAPPTGAELAVTPAVRPPAFGSGGGGGGNGTSSTRRGSYTSASSSTTTTTLTPLSGRVDFEVKKSVKPNGADLPNDMTTLRYFYNLGLEYHHMKRSQEGDGGNREGKDKVDKLSAVLPNLSLEDDEQQQQPAQNQQSEALKLDSNNNSLANMNASSHTSGSNSGGGINTTTNGGGGTNSALSATKSNAGNGHQGLSNPLLSQRPQSNYSGGGGGQQRRFNTRNYSNHSGKDRQSYQRGGGSGGGGGYLGNNNPGAGTPSQHRSHYNDISGGGSGSNHNRGGTNKNGSANNDNALPHDSTASAQYNCPPPGSGQLVPYSVYDLNAAGGDCLISHTGVNGSGQPSAQSHSMGVSANGGGGAGVYIPVQLTATGSPYGLYSGPPPILAASPVGGMPHPASAGGGGAFHPGTSQAAPPQYFNVGPHHQQAQAGPPLNMSSPAGPPRGGGGPQQQQQLATTACLSSFYPGASMNGLEHGGLADNGAMMGTPDGCMPTSYSPYANFHPPPPMPLYCTTNGTMPAQGYWCLPPPPPPASGNAMVPPPSAGSLPQQPLTPMTPHNSSPAAQPATSANNTTAGGSGAHETNGGNNNRRDKASPAVAATTANELANSRVD